VLRLIENLTSFLQSKGLSLLEHRNESSFGDGLWKYVGQVLNARLVIDRGIGYLEIGQSRDAANTEWYDLSILKRLMDPSWNGDTMSIEEQVEFVKQHWDSLESHFSGGNWSRTKGRLQSLLEERMRRRLKYS